MTIEQRVLVVALLVMMLVYEGSLRAQMSRFAVDVTWAGSKSCFDPQSPPFTLNGVPPGTQRLHFAMKDLDAPDFRHGGGTVAYDGQRLVPRGAFSYRGPCPPQGQHHYQWTVEAVDAAGHTLATASDHPKVPSRVMGARKTVGSTPIRRRRLRAGSAAKQ